jgi:hypothetical protein
MPDVMERGMKKRHAKMHGKGEKAKFPAAAKIDPGGMRKLRKGEK